MSLQWRAIHLEPSETQKYFWRCLSTQVPITMHREVWRRHVKMRGVWGSFVLSSMSGKLKLAISPPRQMALEEWLLEMPEDARTAKAYRKCIIWQIVLALCTPLASMHVFMRAPFYTYTRRRADLVKSSSCSKRIFGKLMSIKDLLPQII